MFGYDEKRLPFVECELSRSLRTGVTQFENGPENFFHMARSLLIAQVAVPR